MGFDGDLAGGGDQFHAGLVDEDAQAVGHAGEQAAAAGQGDILAAGQRHMLAGGQVAGRRAR